MSAVMKRAFSKVTTSAKGGGTFIADKVLSFYYKTTDKITTKFLHGDQTKASFDLNNRLHGVTESAPKVEAKPFMQKFGVADATKGVSTFFTKIPQFGVKFQAIEERFTSKLLQNTPAPADIIAGLASSRDFASLNFIDDQLLDLETVNEKGFTALMTVAEECDLQAAKLLIDLGANVNARHEDGRDLLQIALAAGSVQVAKLILKNGFNTSYLLEGFIKSLHGYFDAPISLCNYLEDPCNKQLLQAVKFVSDDNYMFKLEMFRALLKANPAFIEEDGLVQALYSLNAEFKFSALPEIMAPVWAKLLLVSPREKNAENYVQLNWDLLTPHFEQEQYFGTIQKEVEQDQHNNPSDIFIS